MLDKLNRHHFGIGMMRLPYKDKKLDYEQICKMVDYCMEHGINYFDTAHGYLNGDSEIAVRECVTKRYKREEYFLTDKLTQNFFRSRADIRKTIDEQLKICGVDNFDLLLMHNQNSFSYRHFQKHNAYEEALILKKEGKIKHLGISFHDNAKFLEKILIEHPEIEIVQIQFNYLDFRSWIVQSGALYDVCKKYNKPIIVMEPVKGGTLAKLPPKADKVLQDLNNGSNASYALRYVRGFDQVKMIISGMSTFDQVKDNVTTMTDYKPLTDLEKNALSKVVAILKGKKLIACTSCQYCVKGCPKHIPIPDVFSCFNNKKITADWASNMYYQIITDGKGKASDCIKCGKCEIACPQKLSIRKYLVDIAKTFETQDTK